VKLRESRDVLCLALWVLILPLPQNVALSGNSYLFNKFTPNFICLHIMHAKENTWHALLSALPSGRP
jgi:hypothetical protein